VLAIGTAFLAYGSKNLMDYIQSLFSLQATTGEDAGWFRSPTILSAEFSPSPPSST
jgi:hypothetical protein